MFAYLRSSIFFLCLAIATTCGAEQATSASSNSKVSIEAPPDIPDPCSMEARNASGLSWIDRTHLDISQGLCDQVTRLDQFFGNFDYSDSPTYSFVRIRNEISWEDRSGINVKFKPRVRAKLKLPALENRLNLLISDDLDDENELSTDDNNNNEEDRISTALRLTTRAEGRVETDIDVGARFSGGINTFVRGRYRYTLPISDVSLLRFRQEVFWRNQEGFGESSQLNMQHKYRENFIFESSSDATFSEITDGVDWSQRFTLYQQLDEERALSYSLLASGYTRPDFTTDTYGINMRYRKNLYRNWLFAELEPELSWPMDNNREIMQRIFFRLEIQLGNI